MLTVRRDGIVLEHIRVPIEHLVRHFLRRYPWKLHDDRVVGRHHLLVLRVLLPDRIVSMLLLSHLLHFLIVEGPWLANFAALFAGLLEQSVLIAGLRNELVNILSHRAADASRWLATRSANMPSALCDCAADLRLDCEDIV